MGIEPVEEVGQGVVVDRVLEVDHLVFVTLGYLGDAQFGQRRAYLVDFGLAEYLVERDETKLRHVHNLRREGSENRRSLPR